MFRLRLASAHLAVSARASITLARPHPRHTIRRLNPWRAWSLILSRRLVPMPEPERMRNDSAMGWTKIIANDLIYLLRNRVKSPIATTPGLGI